MKTHHFEVTWSDKSLTQAWVGAPDIGTAWLLLGAQVFKNVVSDHIWPVTVKFLNASRG